MCKYFINTELDGIEIKFDSKPEAKTLDTLKKSGFRWHKVKKLWYAKQTPEREELAKTLSENKEPETAPTQPEQKKNKFGIVVGDIFSTSWGCEQTNNNFFQVVQLVGESSVRVVEVQPETVKSEAVSSMAEDRTYKITRDFLPAKRSSIFIKDQVKGDLKRLKSYQADGVSKPQFYLTSYADAYYCEPGNMTTYNSWYY